MFDKKTIRIIMGALIILGGLYTFGIVPIINLLSNEILKFKLNVILGIILIMWGLYTFKKEG